MFSKFMIGQIHVEDVVRKVMGRTPLDLVARHAVCEFGIISLRRLKANQIALSTWGEIQSEYLADPTDPSMGRIQITTDECWGHTHIRWIAPKSTKKEKTAHDTDF